MLAAELCLHTEKRGSAETHSLLVYSTNDKATSRRHKKRDVRQTYRVDNAFESVEAIFDRKHMVFGVRNFSKLLVSRKNGVNREQCWFNTAFFFFSLWLSSVFPFILWAGGDKQMAWLWQTLCSTIKKKIAAQIGSNIAIVFDLSSHQRIGYQWLQGTGHHVGRVTVKMQTALSIGDIREKKFLTSLYDMSTNSSFAMETNNKYNKNSVNGVRSQ